MRGSDAILGPIRFLVGLVLWALLHVYGECDVGFDLAASQPR